MGKFEQAYDPGLQQERTDLAWDRTALSIMVTSVILLRAIGSPYPRAWHLLPLLAFVTGLFVLGTNRHRYVARWWLLKEGWRSIMVVGTVSALLGISGLLTIIGRHL